MTTPEATPPLPDRSRTRRRAVGSILGLAAVGAIAYGAYWALELNHFESTDNAYVNAHVVQVTPQIAGTVLAVDADDTEFVKAGQTLVRLDPADARVALEQAEAQLAQTVREVRTLYANNATLNAQIALREADVARAQADVAKAEDDVARRRPLLASGAVGREEFDHAGAQLTAARSALTGARSAVLAAREQLASNRSLTEGTSVEEHPSVQRAAARVREAYLALERAELSAPVSGIVARRSVQPGQHVAAGSPLMTVVSLSDVWVDANFKEGQLRKLRVGQPVTLKADAYGGKVTFHGSVAGLSAGTGSAFALLPAQNATGNWIKVVQRVPVRIALDAAEIAQHPLQVGLSMDVEVDVTRQDGKTLADTPAAAPQKLAALDDAGAARADAAVQRIVAANRGAARAN